MTEQVVVLIGNSSVGKTFLANYLTKPKFDFHRMRAVPTVVTKHSGNKFHIHECGGSSVVNAIRPTLYKKPRVSIIMIVFALNDKNTFFAISNKYLPEIKKTFIQSKTIPPIFLVGTKDDLVREKTIIHQDTIINCVKKNNLCCYLDVSTRDGKNLDSLKTVVREFWADKPSDFTEEETEGESEKAANQGRIRLVSLASQAIDRKEITKVKKERKKKEPSPAKTKKKRSSRLKLEKTSKKKTRKTGKLRIDKSFRLEKSSLPIHKAIYRDDVDLVKEMISHGISMTTRTKHLNTPLHYAAAGNHVEIVYELIKLPEVQGDEFNVDGETPLTLAAARNHTLVVAALIETGKCDVTIKQKKGEQKYPEELSTDSDTQNIFLEQKTNQQNFMKAIEKKDMKVFDELISKVSVNCDDDTGRQAIEHAMEQVGSEEILAKMCNKGVKLMETQWRGHMFYESELKTYWYRRKREAVLIDMLQDEKTYTDKLDPIIDLFVKPIAPMLLKLLTSGKRGSKMGEKQKELLMKVTQMLNAISSIHINHTALMKELMKRMSFGNPPKETRIATAIREMQLEAYYKFTKSYLPLSELVKHENEGEIEKFKMWIENQEKKSGINFWKTLMEPGLRLHKYKSYVTRLLNDCLPEAESSADDKILKAIYQASLDNIITQLEKIDAESQKLKGRNMMISMSSKLDEKYGYTDLNVENTERSYIYHEEEGDIRYVFESPQIEESSKKSKKIKYKEPRFDVDNPPKKLDIYFFSDIVFVGDPLRKTFLYFSFVERKMILEVLHNCITIGFFSKHSVKPDYEFTFDTPLPKKWTAPLQRSYLSNIDYYSSTVLILDHTNDISERSRFHAIPVKLRNVDRVKIRHDEIDHLEEVVKGLEEDVRNFKRKIQNYKTEARNIEIDEERMQKEKEERREKMMEMVRIQKEIQKQQLQKQKEEEEYVRKMREQEEELRRIQKGSKKKKKKGRGFGKKKKKKKDFDDDEDSRFDSLSNLGMLNSGGGVNDLVSGILGGDESNDSRQERGGGGLLAGILGDLGGLGGNFGMDRDGGGRDSGDLGKIMGMGIGRKPIGGIGLPKVDFGNLSNDNDNQMRVPSSIKNDRFDAIMNMDLSGGDTPASPLMMTWESSFTKEAEETQAQLEALERELAALED